MIGNTFRLHPREAAKLLIKGEGAPCDIGYTVIYWYHCCIWLIAMLLYVYVYGWWNEPWLNTNVTYDKDISLLQNWTISESVNDGRRFWRISFVTKFVLLYNTNMAMCQCVKHDLYVVYNNWNIWEATWKKSKKHSVTIHNVGPIMNTDYIHNRKKCYILRRNSLQAFSYFVSRRP